MKTRLAVLASCLALGAAVGLHGCADNRASVQVQAICYPTDDCTFSSECDAVLLGNPAIDIMTSTSDTLILFVQVQNQLPDNGNVGVGRLNTNDAHIDQVVTEYEGAKTGTVYSGANQWVPAAGSTVIGLELGPFALAGNVLARVRLQGYYDDGTRFETGDFPIAVEVCGVAGCVFNPCAAGVATCPPGGAGQGPLACESASTEPTPTP